MTQITPEQIRWRVGSTTKDKSKGMLLGYIDSRTAMAALDALDGKWSDEYSIVSLDGSQGVQCALTANGVVRTDVGVPSNTEGLKGAYSDALKRAAVKHGIGRELYELPTIWVKLDERGRPMGEPTFINGRWTLPSNAGSVFYDHEPVSTPDAARAPATRPAAVAQVPPAAATAPDEAYEDVSALFDADEIAAAVGGERLADKPPYVVKAEQKAAAQRGSSDECPEHGAIKVKENKRGLYCATKLADGTWCPWSKAKAA